MSETDEKLDLNLTDELWTICNSPDHSETLEFIQTHFTPSNVMHHLTLIQETNQFTRHGWIGYESALSRCVASKNISVFEYLHEQNILQPHVNCFVRINKKDSTIKYPLIREAAYFCPDILRLLLTYPNTNPNISVTKEEYTALTTTCGRGLIDVIEILLNDDRIDLFHLNFQNVSCLEQSAWMPKFRIGIDGFSDLIGLCLLLNMTNGMDKFQIDRQDKYGDTPLHAVTEARKGAHWMHRMLLLLCFGGNGTILNGRERGYLDACDEEWALVRGIEGWLNPMVKGLVKDIVSELSQEIRRLVQQREDLITENRKLRKDLRLAETIPYGVITDDDELRQRLQELSEENERLKKENDALKENHEELHSISSRVMTQERGSRMTSTDFLVNISRSIAEVKQEARKHLETIDELHQELSSKDAEIAHLIDQLDGQESNTSHTKFVEWFSKNFERMSLFDKMDAFVSNGLDDISLWMDLFFKKRNDDISEMDADIPNTFHLCTNLLGMKQSQITVFKQRLKAVSLPVLFDLTNVGQENVSRFIESGLNSLGAMCESKKHGVRLDDEKLTNMGVVKFGDRVKILTILRNFDTGAKKTRKNVRIV